MQPSRDIHRLLEIMAALRTPGSGCPWDLEQNYTTIAPYTIEEAYEVAEAALRGDKADLCEELGDLLLQVVFYAQMAREEDAFDFSDVVMAISSKLIRRHPHVFADPQDVRPENALKLWDGIKAQEKAEKNPAAALTNGALSEVALGQPALARARKLQIAAAKVGFDWAEAPPILEKIREELGEVEEAMASKPEAVEEEIGDLLFAIVNLARRLKVDPDNALRLANIKFERRFSFMELKTPEKHLSDLTLDEMEELWRAAKAQGL